jgi:hypothetical protein
MKPFVADRISLFSTAIAVIVVATMIFGVLKSLLPEWALRHGLHYLVEGIAVWLASRVNWGERDPDW